MIVKFKDIEKISEKIKTYVEKNHILPKTITVNNVKYAYTDATYLIAKAIQNPGKDVTLIKVKKAPKPSGESVDLKFTKNQYIALSKKLSNFISKKKRMPNYLNYGGKKIKQRVFLYSISKILVYYRKNNKLPGTCKFKTSETIKPVKKLKQYLTSKGCSGMGQCTGYYCACNSLQQAFYRLTGIKVDEKTIAGWAGTTTSGTDHQGINTAVAKFNKKYNKNMKITWYNFSDLGKNDTERWSKLSSLIKNGALFIHLLYRNKYGHYEVPKSVGSENLSILNSLGDSCGGGTYCGYVETRSKSTQRSYMNGINQKSVAVLTI